MGDTTNNKGTRIHMLRFFLRDVVVWIVPFVASLLLAYRSGPERYLTLALYSFAVFAAALLMKIFLEPRWNRKSAFSQTSSMAYRQGSVIFPLLQFFWVMPLVPFTVPVWLPVLVLFTVFGFSPSFPRPPRFSLLPVQTVVGVLFLLQLFYPLEAARFYADSFGSLPPGGTVRSCSGAWGVHCSLSHLMPWGYFFVLLFFTIMDFKRMLMPLVLTLVMGILTYSFGARSLESILSLVSLGLALVLVPGRPSFSNRLWFIYTSLFGGLYGFLLVLAPVRHIIIQNSVYFSFGLYLVVSILAAEIVTGMVPYISGSGRAVRPR